MPFEPAENVFQSVKRSSDKISSMRIKAPPLMEYGKVTPQKILIQDNCVALQEQTTEAQSEQGRGSILSRLSDMLSSPFKRRGTSEDKDTHKKPGFPCSCGPSSEAFACVSA